MPESLLHLSEQSESCVGMSHSTTTNQSHCIERYLNDANALCHRKKNTDLVLKMGFDFMKNLTSRDLSFSLVCIINSS